MSQSIYDAAVACVGYLHIKNELPISDLIHNLSNKYYKDSIIDDGVWEEIGETVVDYLSFVDEQAYKKEMEGMIEEKKISLENIANTKLNFLHDYYEYCMKYRSDGKKKGWFSGMVFMKSEKIPNKDKKFVLRTEKYLKENL